ncbi:MAG: carboxypeptidase M32 [Nitrosarchaeum sp.]|nr:carboxypeptidase M32 [Nitrosarchaeum sp.]
MAGAGCGDCAGGSYMSAYERFLELVRRHGLLGQVEALLDWDRQVMMPSGAGSLRAQEEAVVAQMRHEVLASEEMGRALRNLLSGDLDEDLEVVVREVAWQHARACKVPADLVAQIARAASIGNAAWQEARAKSDFAVFAPHLTRMVELRSQEAHAIDASRPAYDVLLEGYEKDLSREEVDSFLRKIRDGLVHVRPRPPVVLPEVQVDEAVQLPFIRGMAQALGYDAGLGRIDLSTHPFTTFHGRFTTRLSSGWVMAVLGALHEFGHALYEQQLPREQYGTPLGSSMGMSVHESQSRLWENHVGRSDAFWSCWFPKMREAYGLPFDKEVFVAALSSSRPGFIRVDADELTYPLHVILRYEIERDLVEGRLGVAELPRVWNERMNAYFGRVPPDDARGCLQDTHWSSGAIGYFPTYVLGSMIAAQLWRRSSSSSRMWRTRCEREGSELIGSWLKEKVHSHGQTISRAGTCEAGDGPGVVGRCIYAPPYGAVWFVRRLSSSICSRMT